MTMMDLAHHIIAVAHEKDIPVTNLQLQKVMYFSLKNAMKNKLLSDNIIEETYDEPFLVWRYGPVEKKVYERYRIFGSDAISGSYKEHRKFSNLNTEIISLLNKDPFYLVEVSHKEKFWENNKEKIRGWRSNIPYKLKNIKTGAA